MDLPSGIDDRLLTIREVSEITQLSVGSLYHLVSAGRIPVVRLSRRCLRFRLSALEKWFQQLSDEPKYGALDFSQAKRRK
jgi:excisionase family DNA binding protein